MTYYSPSFKILCIVIIYGLITTAHIVVPLSMMFTNTQNELVCYPELCNMTSLSSNSCQFTLLKSPFVSCLIKQGMECNNPSPMVCYYDSNVSSNTSCQLTFDSKTCYDEHRPSNLYVYETILPFILIVGIITSLLIPIVLVIYYCYF
jgi:hypothetical protein